MRLWKNKEYGYWERAVNTLLGLLRGSGSGVGKRDWSMFAMYGPELGWAVLCDDD